MANAYDTGDLVRCTGTFTDAAGAAVDPTTVAFKVKDPSANTTTYTYGVDAELVQQAAGIYYLDVSIDETGDWWYRFESTGTGQAGGEDNFYVRPSQV